LTIRLSTASALLALPSRSGLFDEDGQGRQSGNRIEPCNVEFGIQRQASQRDKRRELQIRLAEIPGAGHEQPESTIQTRSRSRMRIPGRLSEIEKQRPGCTRKAVLLRSFKNKMRLKASLGAVQAQSATTQKTPWM
jgi:hypothetical protein